MSIESQWIARVTMHTTAESSLPSLVSKGSSITQSNWSTAGFDTFNSKNLEDDDYDLEADSISITREQTLDELLAARDRAPEDVILIGDRITEFSFKVLSVEEALWAFDSNISQGANISQIGQGITNRHVCIEIRNLALVEFEKCTVTINALEGGSGEGGVFRSEVTCKPLKNDNAPGGFRIHHYQP